MKNQTRALRRHHAERIKRKIARQYFIYRGMFDNRLWSEPQRLEEHLKWCEENHRYWQGRWLQARTLSVPASVAAIAAGGRERKGT